jgi:hypothetical protein
MEARSLLGTRPSTAADQCQMAAVGRHGLYVVGSEVHFEGQVLDLSEFYLTLRLFRLFAIAKDGRCGVREVCAMVYLISPNPEHTKRYRKSARVRAVKLISRARRLAKQWLSRELDWFSYERKSRTWTLYRGYIGDGGPMLHS